MKYNNLFASKRITTFEPRPTAYVSQGSSNSNYQGVKRSGPEEWKKHKTTDSITWDRKVWHWCPFHKSKEHNYDGLYVSHKGTIEDHKAWERRKAEWKAKELKGKKNTDNNNSNETKKMIVMEMLKNALVSYANS